MIGKSEPSSIQTTFSPTLDIGLLSPERQQPSEARRDYAAAERVDDYRVPDQQPRHVANALSHRIACLGRAGHDVSGTASAVQPSTT